MRNRTPEYRRMERLSQQKRRSRLRKFVNEIKVKSGCLLCGEKHPSCLQFHHLYPGDKVNTINRLVIGYRSERALLNEIRKCVVLCANCHLKVHHNQREMDKIVDLITSLNQSRIDK